MIGYSSFVVVFALWLAVAVAALTVILLAVIVGIRLLQRRRLAWSEKLRTQWRPLLTQSVVSVPGSVPRLSDRQAAVVMPMWSYYHEFLRGSCKDNLNILGRRAGLDLYAKGNLRSDSTKDRLMAIEALGNLRDRESRRLLRPISEVANPYLSLAAVHALLRIDPREEIGRTVELITLRPDWSPARVIAMLSEAGPDVISVPLARAVVEIDPAYKPLLIIYLGTAEEPIALQAIRQVLMASDDDQVLLTCLYQLARMSHPEGLRLLRTYLDHSNWLIQLHAVTGLGRMGGEEDVDDLVRMLCHRRFWIRYRAAQALTKLPTMTRERLVRIRRQQTDRFATDILEQVIATELAA